MKPVNAVPLDKISNDKLDDIVAHKQESARHRVTKKGVVADLIDKAFNREFK